MDKQQKKELYDLALSATKNAYAPYSGYKVGAALLASSGKIYLGCNIENASYSPTICAERSAFSAAVSAGERSFLAIAVAGGKDGVITSCAYPCGVCRQVMAEFCKGDFLILAAKNGDGDYEEHTLSELLPHGFGPQNLDN